MVGHWLLTGATYGAWWPSALAESGQRSVLPPPPVRFSREQARIVGETFQATAYFRDWRLLAVAVMKDEFQVVLRAPHTLRSEKLLWEFKAYAGRELNSRFARPASRTWWTPSGLRRPLRDDRAVADAVNCVLFNNPAALYTWRPQGAPRTVAI
jgi:REP element-mobilizing transposase RayT